MHLLCGRPQGCDRQLRDSGADALRERLSRHPHLSRKEKRFNLLRPVYAQHREAQLCELEPPFALKRPEHLSGGFQLHKEGFRRREQYQTVGQSVGGLARQFERYASGFTNRRDKGPLNNGLSQLPLPFQSIHQLECGRGM